jgi:hypothetical protein
MRIVLEYERRIVLTLTSERSVNSSFDNIQLRLQIAMFFIAK